ncbi:MAG: hypothetical protein OXI60_04285 [Acidiferrobacterales bacterium]|nr:hypothetical protein [Acidiferrobacterales bacterium]
MNKQGGGARIWNTATLFVVSNVGIVYGTPEMADSGHIKDAHDAVVLKRSGLKLLMEDKSNVFGMDIRQKPPTEMTGFSRKASTAVAKQILSEMKSRNLLKSIGSNIN